MHSSSTKLYAYCISMPIDYMHYYKAPICINADTASLMYLDTKPWRRYFSFISSIDAGNLISYVTSSHLMDLGIQLI